MELAMGMLGVIAGAAILLGWNFYSTWRYRRKRELEYRKWRDKVVGNE